MRGITMSEAERVKPRPVNDKAFPGGDDERLQLVFTFPVASRQNVGTVKA
jgi:hypothetical protein